MHLNHDYNLFPFYNIQLQNEKTGFLKMILHIYPKIRYFGEIDCYLSTYCAT